MRDPTVQDVLLGDRARDFNAEREWLLRLPPGPTTDQRQDEWERDPQVIAWRKSDGHDE